MTLAVIGLLTLLAAIGGMTAVIVYSRLPRTVKLLIVIALLLRVVGAAARYEVLFQVYDGVGDAVGYYERSVDYADQVRDLNFSRFVDPSVWYRSEWWGTQFVHFPATVVLAFIGPTMLGGFLAFSLLAFIGLCGFAVAYRRSYPEASPILYFIWLFLFPSLWYWPSSIGKEALLMLGIGLTVAGFVGREERIGWLSLGLGLFVVFGVRPELSVVLIVSMLLAQWLGFGGRWTVGKGVQTIAIVGLGVAAIWYAAHAIGVGTFDIEGMHSYVEDNPSRYAEGRTHVDAVEVGPEGIPSAMVNVLFRPFPWEVTNPMVFISALEILTLWCIVWFRRRNLLRSLRRWRSDRFLRLGVCFVVIYTIGLGLMLVNLGIIARQRIFLFPFLFLLLEAHPSSAAENATTERSGRRIDPRVDDRSRAAAGVTGS